MDGDNTKVHNALHNFSMGNWANMDKQFQNLHHSEMAQLRQSETIPFSRKEVFNLLTDPHQMPPLLKDKIDVEVMTEAVELKEGSEYSFIFTRFKISQKVRWEVKELVKGHRITYRQIEGIFPKWEHTLSVEDKGSGKTEVVDQVEYQLPFGVLGLLVNDLILRKDLKSLFRFRLEKASEILSSC